MTTDLPPPLVPPDVDLRDYREFPLEFDRLFDSDTWARWNDRERVVGLRLWCKSWHQEPPGSLPDGNKALAKLAGYGDAPSGVKAWQKIRPSTMDGAGWIKCSDGRWYHPVVAEKVENKWRTKRQKQMSNTADAERKRLKRRSTSAGQPMNVRRTTAPVNQQRPPDMPPMSDTTSAGQTPLVPPETDTVDARQTPKGRGREKDAPPSSAPPLPTAARGADAPPSDTTRDDLLAFGKAKTQENQPRKGNGDGRLTTRGTRLAPDWEPDPADCEFAAGIGLDPSSIAADFRDYWVASPGQRGVKLSWPATWRRWCRKAAEQRSGFNRRGPPSIVRAGARALALLREREAGAASGPANAEPETAAEPPGSGLRGHRDV